MLKQFSDYDIWNEGKIPLDALSLFIYSKFSNKDKSQQFNKKFEEMIQA